MLTEEQAAADAAAKAAADAGAGTKDAAYWEAEAKKAFTERDAAKIKVKELSPAAQKLKEIEDANKSEVQRLSDDNAALKAKADRADALTLAVQETFDAEVATLTDAQKAAIVGDTPDAKLRHLRALRAAGMLGTATKPPVPGGNLPGGGNGSMTQEQFLAGTESQRKAWREKIAKGEMPRPTA